jgi:hypothetical protein
MAKLKLLVTFVPRTYAAILYGGGPGAISMQLTPWSRSLFTMFPKGQMHVWVYKIK